MRILHVDASPKRYGSDSKKLSEFFVNQIKKVISDIEVDYIDLSIETPPHLTQEFIEAMYTSAADRNLTMKQALAYSDELCARVLMCDMLVFAMPMHNFSMPSSFKAFIDNLIRFGLTYHVDKDGTTTGNLNRQKVLFITTRGADLRPGISPWAYMDALRPSLEAAFSFIGVDHAEFVDAQPLENNNQISKSEVLDRAYAQLTKFARNWVT